VDLVVPWVVFPAVLLALAAGWGLAIDRLSGERVPGALLLPLGLAGIVVVAGIVTSFSVLARFATPAVVGGAAAGLVAAWPWPRVPRAALWPAAAAALVFACYAAPIVLSGDATFAGYLTLDDSATLWAMTDRMLEHGRSLDGLPQSTYEATLATSLMVGYPMGSLLPLGIGARLVGQDVAWVFQPYLALVAALLALVLWRLLASAVAPRWWRFAAVVVAAQPALLYAYGLWTGVKELTAALLVALAAALAVEVRRDAGVRAWLPLATVVAAIAGVLSLGGAVWLLPLAVWLLVERRSAVVSRNVAVAGAVLVVLALPAVAEAARFLGDGHVASWRDAGHLANLIQPLNPLQALGVWPSGDFRLRPERWGPTLVLVLLVAGLVVAGAVRSIRRRDALLPFAACAIFGALAYWALGSPWIEAKAFATASPALLALAASGCAWIAVSGRRVEAGVVAVLVSGGVLWSNAYAFGNVNLAPRDQLAELERIGDDFAGQGPALMTEYQPQGVRHFLRRLDAEGASELRRHVVPLRNGSSLPKLRYANLDAFRLDGLLYYRTLVLRRSPFESRPPAPYSLVQEGRWYEVWQRPETYPAIVEHLPLGDATHPGAVPSCAAVARLAQLGSTLAAVPRENPLTVASGSTAVFQAARRDRYSVWLGGSTRKRATAFVDGREIGSAGPHLNNEGQLIELGNALLAPGAHAVEVRFARDRLRPGTGGAEYGVGPLVVAPTTQRRRLVTVRAADATRLCGRTLDWIEALR
jgi:hypothetical protein